MPELHKLMPALAISRDRGLRVALVTEGRISGVSGKVPAAIRARHECVADGPLARVQDSNPIHLDFRAGRLEVLLERCAFFSRLVPKVDLPMNESASGYDLFALFRRLAYGPRERSTIFV